MIRLYYRDLRRHMERLEARYFPEPPVKVYLYYLDKNKRALDDRRSRCPLGSRRRHRRPTAEHPAARRTPRPASESGSASKSHGHGRWSAGARSAASALPASQHSQPPPPGNANVSRTSSLRNTATQPPA